MAKKKADYTITLQLGDQTYKSNGASVLEALTKLKKPDKMMLKGVLTLTHGNLKREELFWPQRMKRLFYNPNFQAIQAKFLALGLK